MQAQSGGSAMPEVVSDEVDATLTGTGSAFPIRAVVDFLNHTQAEGRLTVEVGKNRIRFALAGGRVQAVYSPTATVDTVAAALPAELADLSPLLSMTMGEHQDASMAGLVKLLERSLADPRRLRGLLRCQSAVLTHATLNDGAAEFVFEPKLALPPMFQAFPLQISLAALAVEGARLCIPSAARAGQGAVVFARHARAAAMSTGRA